MGDLSEDGMPLNSPLYLFPQTEEQVPLKAWAEERQAEQFIPVRNRPNHPQPCSPNFVWGS
jgi:hypothetical protein